MSKYFTVFLFFLLSYTEGQTLRYRIPTQTAQEVYFADGNILFIPAGSFAPDTVHLHFHPFYRTERIAEAGLPDSQQADGRTLIFAHAFQLTATDASGNPVPLEANRQVQLRLATVGSLTQEPPTLFHAQAQRWQPLPQRVVRTRGGLPDGAEPREGAAKEGVIAPWEAHDGQSFWTQTSLYWAFNLSKTGFFALGYPGHLPTDTQIIHPAKSIREVVAYYTQQRVFFRASNRLVFLKKQSPEGVTVYFTDRPAYVLSADTLAAGQADTLYLPLGE